MNTNLIHNLLNIGMAAVAVLTLPEVLALFPPEVGIKIVGAMAVTKTTLNVWRDGLTGLVKKQPAVQ